MEHTLKCYGSSWFTDRMGRKVETSCDRPVTYVFEHDSFFKPGKTDKAYCCNVHAPSKRKHLINSGVKFTESPATEVT